MKKTLFFLLALMMPLMASADEVIAVNGIQYNCYTINNVNYAQVKGYETGLTIANIPGSITSGGKQYTVTCIGEYNQEIKGKTNVEIIPVSAWQTADFMYSMFRWAGMHIVKYDHRSVTKSLPVSLPKIVWVTK